MNKKELSESDIKAKFITPGILNSGWDEHTQLRREVYFTDGRIYVKGERTASNGVNKEDYFGSPFFCIFEKYEKIYIIVFISYSIWLWCRYASTRNWSIL